MITIPRSLASRVRKVFSRGLGLTPRSASPPVHFEVGSEGLAIRCSGRDAAIEYRQPDELPPEQFTVPFDLLKRCEGKKDEPVALQREDDEIIAAWPDAGIPQTGRFPVVEFQEFPAVPEVMATNGTELLTALRHAHETAEREATRYALNCLQLRGGPDGRVAATDGHQLFVQAGFDFPWEGDLLVPSNRTFSSAELNPGETCEVGKTADWVALRTGPWTILLRIEKEARFPEIESHLPNASVARSSLLLSDEDALFLAKALKRLPASNEYNNPVTVDLNGEVAVRAQGEDQSKPTELILTSSWREGEAVHFNTNRDLLSRAVRLGFRRIDVFDPESPVCCRDQDRSYVWALLTKEGAIDADPDATRITPSIAGKSSSVSYTTPKHERKTTPPMSKPSTNGNGKPNNGAHESDHEETTTILAQAEALRSTLQDALTQTRELVTSLKKQKKQTRLVQSTIASLRQLQTVEV